MTVPYKINDAVLLSREREGIIRYIGNVHFSNGIWCGIELIGGSVGTNDGKIQGRRYFTCPRNRGLFCKIGKVRRKFRKKDHSATSRQKRKASLELRLFHKSLAEHSILSELDHKNQKHNKHNNIPNDRYFQKGKPPNNKSNNIPNDIHITNERYSRKQRSQTTPNTKVNWLNERLNHISRKQKNERAKTPKQYKPGPRDIGKIKGSNWKPIEYEIDITKGGKGSNISWKEERLNSKSKRIRSKSANETKKIYKAGPRDIGRVSGKSWKPIQLTKKEKEKLNKGHFLDDRIEKRSRKRSKTHKIYKKGPRDIGRIHGWKPNNKLNKKEKSKKFKIAVEGKQVDPKKLTKSKAKNKQQMKGKNDMKNKKKNKNKKFKKRVKNSENDNVNKNKHIFDSFRRNRKDRSDRSDRQSVMVELNMQNKNIKNKHIKNDNKKRQSAHIKQINSKYSNVNQRANAYKHINYQEFTAYNPLNDNENKIENENENENDNVEIERYKHFSAANESEANFDLDDDGIYDENINININNNNNNIIGDKRPSEHIYELFGVDNICDINYSDFSDNEIGNNEELKSTSVSLDEHEHEHELEHDSDIYEGNISPSGHDNLFDLFDIDNERSNYNKPLPKPPNKPLPNRKGRIKGIDKYVGKWIVTFIGIKPNIIENKQMNIANISRQKRRTSSVAKKYHKNVANNTFTYSIYKDGSVQIHPKSSFGWNGLANIIFDSIHQRFEIHTNNNNNNNNNEYEYILLNRNGTLHIQHFNHINNYKTPFIGTGIKG